jgi:gas vesicle protein GvpG
MGFLDQLLTFPLAPVRGVSWLASRLTDEAIREMYDPAAIHEQLLQAELEHELGQLTEDELAEVEDELLARLEIGRQMGTSP